MASGSQTLTGSKVLLIINGQRVAFASNVTYTINHNVQPIELIGNPQVTEHAELGTTVEFSCSMFRVNRGAAVSLGLMPRLSEFLNQPELVAEIFDLVKDEPVMILNGLKCISRSGNYDARGVWTETLNFVARRAYDEAGQ